MWRSLPLLLLLLTLPARAAAEPPRCDAAREGGLSCQAGRLCLCRHERGGSMTGRAEGHRWDCGPLRPDCPTAGPSLAPAWPPGLPPPQLWLPLETLPGPGARR